MVTEKYSEDTDFCNWFALNYSKTYKMYREMWIELKKPKS